MNSNKSFSMVPIKRTDVFQTIIQRITELIEQQPQPGDRLPSERELSESLGVSRTSIRQALKVLEAAGKVETRVGSGTYVTDNVTHDANILSLIRTGVSKEFIKSLIVARSGIERTIFEECYEKFTPENIQELRDLLQEHEQEVNYDMDHEDGGLDLSFEAKVAEINGNDILIKLQQQIHQLWVQAWREYGFAPERKELLHQEHLEILQAFEQGNKDRVIELIVQHVDKNIN